MTTYNRHRKLMNVHISKVDCAGFIVCFGVFAQPGKADPLPPDGTYRPLPTVPFEVARLNDEAIKPSVALRQRNLLNSR